ncbi:PQQ-binding-like beta-propeller repeat protein [Haloarchaeobius sp. DFWS5]|uniref:outer membrane protein assembly factor BamB family protein n=1 Tax=Haloarchaeobius sp. DFWS5 TaxID=3446114 RepID=UPI003EBFFDF4
MQRRDALAGLASVLVSTGCLRLQDAGGAGTESATRTSATATSTATNTRTTTQSTERPETTEAETTTETEDSAGPPVTGTSRSFAYDAANTGYYDAAGLTDKPRKAWTVSFSDAITTVPAIVDGTLYVSADGLAALDARTGEERWSAGTGGRSSPSVHDGTVYSSDYRTVGAYDAESGDALWEAEANASRLTVADGLVVAAGDEGVAAIDAETGSVQWRVLTQRRFDSAPAVVDGTVYVADRPRDQPGRLSALDLDTGDRQWQYEVDEADGSGAHYYFTGEPVYADGTVFLACENRVAYAVDAETGTEVWQTTTMGGLNPAPAVVDETVYFGQDGGAVLALDSQTGNIEWEARDGTGSIVSNVVATQESVFVVDDSGLLVAYDRSNGNSRYKLGLARSRARCGPLVLDDWLFVGDGDGTLHAFTTEN